MSVALRLFHPGESPQGKTLDDVYRLLEPEYPTTMSSRSKVEHRSSLKHWRELTGNPQVTKVTRKTITEFRDKLIGTGMSAATINKIWRTLRSFFRYTHDELKWIDAIPSVSYTMRSKLVDASDPVPRELLSHAEIAQLWANCLQARYPVVEPCLTWRTFLVLAWQYGMRTGDLVALPRSAILLNQKLVRWAADKTSKLQGLPLTEVAAWHLERWLQVAPPGPRLFEGLRKPGHVNHTTGQVVPGYYTEWNRVITADLQPRLLIKNLRQAMVTEMNDTGHGDDIGGWAAGHSPVGVTQKNYDTPTARVRKAFDARPVPPCFLWGMRDADLPEGLPPATDRE